MLKVGHMQLHKSAQDFYTPVGRAQRILSVRLGAHPGCQYSIALVVICNFLLPFMLLRWDPCLVLETAVN